MYYSNYYQQWFKWSAGSNNIIKTLDSNLFITGAGPYDYNQITFIKTSPLGNHIWSLHNYDSLAGNPPNNLHYYGIGQAAQTESDSGYVAIGGLAINGYSWDYAPYIFKLDKNGNYLWAKYYSHDTSFAVKITYADAIISNYSGGFLIAGEYLINPDSINLRYALMLINCDYDGNILWKKYYPHPGSLFTAIKIVKTFDNGYFIFGSNSGGSIPAIIKVDSSGNVQFYKEYYIGTSMTSAFSMTAGNTRGEYFITGSSKFYNTVGGYSPFILSVDTLGNPNWFKVYNGTGTADSSVLAKDIAVTSSGNIFVCGVRTRNGLEELSLFKTDNTGNWLWSRAKNGAAGPPYYDGAYEGNGLLNFNGDIMMIGFFSGAWTFSHLSPQGDGICNYTSQNWYSISPPAIANNLTVPPDSIPTINILPPPITFQFIKNIPSSIVCPTIVGAAINENQTAEGSITISPNPTSGEFRIMISDLRFENAEVEIYNVYGEKVYSEKMSNHKSVIINLEQPNGIYFISIKTQQGTANKKLIINK